MPHLTLEYTGNIEQIVDFQRLFIALHRILESTGSIPIGNCKSRAVKRPMFCVATGDTREGFVHLDIRFLEGRSVEVKQQLGREILEKLTGVYSPTIQRLDLQITVEIQDIERQSYFKFPAGTISSGAPAPAPRPAPPPTPAATSSPSVAPDATKLAAPAVVEDVPEPRVRDGLETRAVRDGGPRPPGDEAGAGPEFPFATYASAVEGDDHDTRDPRMSSTPGHRALAAKLASLEGAEAALSCASGMSAVTTTLLSVLGAGDHLLIPRNVHRGTHAFVTGDLPELGIEVDFVDLDAPQTWAGRLRGNTRAIYVETISNPLLEVADLPAVADFAAQQGITSIVDNTFATPVNCRPPELGFDLSLHSATRYLNGHHDVVAGVVIGRREAVIRVGRKLDHLGGALDPRACFLLHRGLETLVLRVRRQNENAMRLALMLDGHPAVERVHHPGLPHHPHHERARGLLEGFGGVVSFEVPGGEAAAQRVVERLRLAAHAPGLGGVATLVTRPAATSHAGLDPGARRALGISDGLLRVALGIESSQDLLRDFHRALETG